ncbi:TPA: hypothetical protein ACPVX8_002914 [Vibrio parahaemolyticus]
MDIVVLPYRDAYFWNEFGTSVRDLQIIEILSRSHQVTVINRPVSIYERFLNKRKNQSTYKKLDNIEFIDETSFDVFGPIKGREWTVSCYDNILEQQLIKVDSKGKPFIFLDFSPFALPNKIERFDNLIYWYDLIDNFTIHNRFSEQEKRLVSEKYKFVSANADYVTAVSEKAITCIKSKNKSVLNNGVYDGEIVDSMTPNSDFSFDFGFVGFITDKLDVDFINHLAEKYKVGVWGKVFDKETERKLSPKVYIGGAFKYSDLSNIISKFRVGLIPYLKDRLHDESPLKMYEYFKYLKPCVASINFEINSDYYYNYNDFTLDNMEDMLSEAIEKSGDISIRKEIKEDWYLSVKVKNTLSLMGILE